MIELLVVIAILAVLAVAVVLVLNPVELIKESRDTTRIEDLGTINRALSYLQVDQTNAFFGTSTVVYVSIPDTSTACANLGLPSLPTGYTYGCAPTSTYRKADGTGWIPLDFFSISYGSPLAKLPIDPINTTSTGLYYTYIPGGSWKLTALFESAKRAPEANKDGGIDAAIYEVGNNLTTISPGRGLVGYWSFEEAGTSASDTSGWGNTGTMYSSTTLTDLHTSSGKLGSGASFDGADDYVDVGVGTGSLNQLGNTFTMGVWIKTPTPNSRMTIFSTGYSGTGPMFGTSGPTPGGLEIYYPGVWVAYTVGNLLSANTWHQVAYARTGTGAGTHNFYIDGVKQTLTLDSASNFSDTNVDKYIGYRVGVMFNGLIDDIRIYNRALSAAEIQALYNATR